MNKKNLDNLMHEALDNIRTDRKSAREFLNEIANQIAGDPEQNKYLSPVFFSELQDYCKKNDLELEKINLDSLLSYIFFNIGFRLLIY